MYKHILVAVDGSDTSNLALQEAIKLAKEQQASLRLVHVFDATPAYVIAEMPYPVSDFRLAMREAGQKVLATCVETARQAGIDANTKFIVLEALTQHICDAIIDEAKRWPADLIVIGTHGRHGFNRLILGSVAEGVVRLAAKPVLVICGS
jgi:nucleotide-binding universal stress UspA family protein